MFAKIILLNVDHYFLLVGSEGSLGIVTKVSILTPAKLSSVNLAFLSCEDYPSCQVYLQCTKLT